MKKIRGKESCATVPLRQDFGFQRTRQFKNIFGRFFKPSWAEKNVTESSELAGDCRESCGIAEVKF
jgi:hypothetical protein